MDTVDVLPPLYSIYSNCGDFLISVSDNRSFSISKDTYQLDAGIKDIPNLLSAKSYNISNIILDSTFKINQVNYQFSFRLNVLDRFDTAFAVFFVNDDNQIPKNNVKYDSIKYYPQLLEITPDNLSYGSIYIDSSVSKEIEIRNVAGFEFLIKEIALKTGTSFRIIEKLPKTILLRADSAIKLNIQYKPLKEISNIALLENDTLIIKNECLTYRIALSGSGVKAKIIVEDFDFDICQVGNTICKDKTSFPETVPGLKVSNPGTGILKLNGYRIEPPYSPYILMNPNPNPENAQVFPGVSLNLESLCFAPKQAGEFFADLIISNNAYGADSIAKIRGIAYNKGPYLRVLSFGEKRVLSNNKSFIKIKNSDDKPYQLSGFEFENNTPDFRVMYEEMDLKPSLEFPILLFPESSQEAVLKELIVPIEFSPKSEGFKEVKIKPIFSEKGQKLDLIVFNYIRGIGVFLQSKL